MGDREAKQNRDDDLLLLEEVAASPVECVHDQVAASQGPGTPWIPAGPTCGFQAGRG